MASPIKTVVVLVQQDRSFDHMMGWMKFLNREIKGITGSESNPLSTFRPNANRVHFNNQAGCLEAENYPCHSFEAVYEQVFGVPWSSESPRSKEVVPTMEGFVQQAERTGEGMSKTVMNGFKPDAIPVYKELMAEFAACDRWFSSVPASDQPNRLYVHSATSHGSTSSDIEMVMGGYPQKTIFDSLDEAGFTFGIYYQMAPLTALFYRNLRKLKYMKNFHQFDIEFKKHCEEGKLPNYVVIEQRYFETKFLPGNDDHPSHDVSEGQKFVKHVYEALRSSPQWNEILFIIVYDEHGGFYDHVPTPVAGVPSPDGIVGPEPFKFQFDRLGVRVPAILVSPWIERGTVLHGPSGPYPTSEFEHSSIPATLKKIFNLKEFLTKRDEWAGTFEVVLNRSSPRTDCPVTLPEPAKLRDLEPVEEKKLSEFQQELVQLAAALNGDHRKDIFPDKLVDDMTVIEAVNYVEGAFRVFLDECDKAKSSGAEESHIPSIPTPTPNPRSRPPKTFAQKLCSCLICDN